MEIRSPIRTEDNFKLILKDNSLYIENYKRIISLEDDSITMKNEKNKVVITGNNLKIKRILEKELLVVGEIFKIEVQHD